jgi:hypothetical protein
MVTTRTRTITLGMNNKSAALSGGATASIPDVDGR